MQITKVTSVNRGHNVSKNNSDNRGKVNYSAGFDSTGIKKDDISFGMDPVTVTILGAAAKAAGRWFFGGSEFRSVVSSAESLFDRFDVKPAIETAIALDSKYGDKLYYLDSNNLLLKAIVKVDELSDEHLVNRDLKHNVLEYFYVGGGYRESHAPYAETAFKKLNNFYHGGFKKHLLSKLSSDDGYGLTKFEDLDAAMNGVGDHNFRANLKKSRIKQLQEMEESRRYAQENDNGEPLGYSGGLRV